MIKWASMQNFVGNGQKFLRCRYHAEFGSRFW